MDSIYEHAEHLSSSKFYKKISVSYICWLQNREIYITGTAPYSTGTVIYLCHFW